MIELTNVLVATDFSESADNALRYGRALARSFDATLHVLTIVEDVFHRGLEAESPQIWVDAQADAEERARRLLASRVNTDADERAVARTSNNPAEAIVAYARETHADVIVMGTHGPKQTSPIGLGSVAEKVVRTAPCPVLTVKHPERDFVKAEPSAAAADEA